jgi:hypothetical protein
MSVSQSIILISCKTYSETNDAHDDHGNNVEDLGKVSSGRCGEEVIIRHRLFLSATGQSEVERSSCHSHRLLALAQAFDCAWTTGL